MDKETTKVIRKQRKKERDETKKRRTIYSQSVADITIQKLIEKQHRTNFNRA
jgi:hypothetical protein